MRKILCCACLVLLQGVGTGQAITLGVNLGVKFPTDSLVKDIYGSSFIYGGTLSFHFYWRLSLFVDAGFLDASGATTVSGTEVSLRINSTSYGMRIQGVPIGSRINTFLEGGLVHYTYEEKVPQDFGEDYSKKKTGYFFGLNTTYNLSRRLALHFNLRYEKVDVETFDGTVGLGGLIPRFGVTYRF